MVEIIKANGVEYNEVNKEMLEILKKYLEKNNIFIDKIEVYGLSVSAICGNIKYYISITEESGLAYRNFSKYFYMNKIENGKRKRIKKQDWI